MCVSDMEISVIIKPLVTGQEFIEHLCSRACAQFGDGRSHTCLALSNAQSKSKDLVHCTPHSSGFRTLFTASLFILNLGYGQDA